MFTGIIETRGTVCKLELGELVVRAPAVTEGVRVGDSVAVNGACLTVTHVDPETLAFVAIPETLECTALGELEAGSPVNLERALCANARLDGHIVQGHVDGTGRVRSLERQGEDVRLAIACERSFADHLVPKGSVAIDGVALTVVDVEAEGFDVALIPHTLEVTTLGCLVAGQRVNLEADVLGKYVKRYVEQALNR